MKFFLRHQIINASTLSTLRINDNFNIFFLDTTAPSKKRSFKKKKIPVAKTISNESKSSRCDTSDNSQRSSQKEKKHYVKSENASNSQGAVKKRIKYRQKTMINKTIVDTDDEEMLQDQQRIRQVRKVSRTKTFSETENENTNDEIDETFSTHLQGVFMVTDTNLMNVPNENRALSESPLTVFVKTTRKLFTPIGEAHLGSDVKTNPKLDSPTIVVEPYFDQNIRKQVNDPDHREEFYHQEQVSQLPPLPASPIPQRKVYKEISPSIRLMLAKYNQKISEQDNKSIKSGNSSGSNSPLWRSPISERRVRTQTERYQEELNKLSPLLGKFSHLYV